MKPLQLFGISILIFAGLFGYVAYEYQGMFFATPPASEQGNGGQNSLTVLKTSPNYINALQMMYQIAEDAPADRQGTIKTAVTHFADIVEGRVPESASSPFSDLSLAERAPLVKIMLSLVADVGALNQ